MDYSLSVGAFFFGILIVAAGLALLRFYQPVADNMGSGVASYERFKLAGFLTIVFGIVVMLNLHTLILGWIVSLFIRT